MMTVMLYIITYGLSCNAVSVNGQIFMDPEPQFHGTSSPYVFPMCVFFFFKKCIHLWKCCWVVTDVSHAFFPGQTWIWNGKAWLYFHLNHAHCQKLFFFCQTFSSWIVTDNKGQGSMADVLHVTRYSFCFHTISTYAAGKIKNILVLYSCICCVSVATEHFYIHWLDS